MTLREQLIALMVEAIRTDPEDSPFSEYLADFLIDAGVTVQHWIPVTDPPKKSGEYIVLINGHPLVTHYSAKHKLFNCYDSFSDYEARKIHLDCTHWMPPPELPKEVPHENP